MEGALTPTPPRNSSMPPPAAHAGGDGPAEPFNAAVASQTLTGDDRDLDTAVGGALDDRRSRPVPGPRLPAPWVAFPHFHFMALAPLDVWARLLVGGPGRSLTRVPPAWWPRLALSLFTSALGSTLTLPERLALAPALWMSTRRGEVRTEPKTAIRVMPGAVDAASDGVDTRRPAAGGDARPTVGDVTAILGYFRSGTTHLHYLLACDPRFITPRWYHTVAPQGFVASWLFLRISLVPFISARRPQDDVSLGPEWPAEDDFALNNLSLASSLPGRLVFPSQWYWYQRFHDLQGLSAAEFARWERAQANFLRRLVWADGALKKLIPWSRRPHTATADTAATGRAEDGGDRQPRPHLLLKTPSHTARVPELQRLVGGPDYLRCIHISRKPEEVVRSNVAMLRRTFEHYGLERGLPDSTLEQLVIEEFVATEARYVASRRLLPDNRRIEIRFEDLRSDPIGQVRAIYSALDLPLDRDVEVRMLAYLDSVRDYRQNRYPSKPDRAGSRPAASSGCDAPGPVVDRAPLERLERWFDHERPPVPAVDAGESVRGRWGGTGSEDAAHGSRDESGLPARVGWIDRGAMLAILAMVGVAGLSSVLWMVRAAVSRERSDWWVWPVGIAIGWAGIQAARVGSRALGAVAAGLTLVVMLAVSIPNTINAHYPNRAEIPWSDVLHSTWNEVSAGNTLFWAFMGLFTAWRLASQTRTFPPLPRRGGPARIARKG